MIKKIFLSFLRNIKRLFVTKKNIAIISNNCIGAHIAGRLGLKYNSPTVNLQILPDQYVKFISNLSYYLELDVNEIEPKDFSKEQLDMIYKLYGRLPCELKFPFGIIDNEIIICFQHYHCFEEARNTWNKRKQRVKFNKIVYVFIADVYRYEKNIIEYYNVGETNKLLFILNCNETYPDYAYKLKDSDKTLVVKVCCPKDKHFMDRYSKWSFKSYYEKNFSAFSWINNIVN